jgi:phosphoribosyl 1,2-cyclic phosphate phosphodiesterase
MPEGSPYPSILDLRSIDGDFTVDGPGGKIEFRPFLVDHGSMDALGFRMGPLAYLPDVINIPDAAWPYLAGLRCWVVDALRRTPHPTHAHLALTLDWIARVKPEQAIITNMHVDMDYETLVHELPPTVSPAHDGRVITFENLP